MSGLVWPRFLEVVMVFFLPRNRKSGWDCAMDVAAAGWLGFV